jgi:hypothetical protein
MDARRWLSVVGNGVKGAFAENRSLLSFDEYVDAFQDAPRSHARSSAQYLRDVLDHFGSEERDTPVGKVRRWHLFDLPFEPEARALRVARRCTARSAPSSARDG